MRITNNMMIRRYNSQLTNNLNAINKTSQNIGSWRKFQKGSENPASALKALQVRENVSRLEQYDKNLDAAESWVNQTETALVSVKQIVDQAYELTVQGRNDVLEEGDRAIIANTMRSLQRQMLKVLNSQVAGKFLLGGSNTGTAPFAVNDDGELIFNEQNLVEADEIDEITVNPVYYDLGLGFRMSDDDPDMPDPNSVYNLYTPGVEITGVGKYNIYNLIGHMADAMERGDMASVDGFGYLTDEFGDPALDENGDPVIDDALIENGLFKRIEEAQLGLIIAISSVGEDSKFISYLKEKNDDFLFEADSMLNKLESLDPEMAIMEFKTQQMVYQACLQTGSYILQPSLMDFLRR